MFFSFATEKACDRIQCPFMIKTLNKLEIKGDFLKLISGIYKKLVANIILNGERLYDLLLKLGTRQ